MKSLFLALLIASSLPVTSNAQIGGVVRDLMIGRVAEGDAHYQAGEAQEKEIKSRSIKALVWNIKKAEMEHWQTEFLTYGGDRDFILIQEAYLKSLFHKTLAYFKGFRWDMGISFLDKRNWAYSGTMIGSKVNPVETLVKHSPDVEPLVLTPKSMTFAKYPIKGRKDELLVISVHAINMTPPWTFKRQIKIASEEIRKHEGPVIYAGDFNTWSEGRLDYLYEATRKLGLKAVSFRNGDKRMSFSDNYLDHAFVRGLKVKDAEVMAESRGSDHRPLRLDLELAE